MSMFSTTRGGAFVRAWEAAIVEIIERKLKAGNG